MKQNALSDDQPQHLDLDHVTEKWTYPTILYPL